MNIHILVTIQIIMSKIVVQINKFKPFLVIFPLLMFTKYIKTFIY